MSDVIRNGTNGDCPVCGEQYTMELPHSCPVVSGLEAENKALREAGVKVCDQLDDTRSQLAALILKMGK